MCIQPKAMVSCTAICIILCLLTPAATADTCLGGWPSFPNRTALMADRWGAYYTKVYGEVPSDPSAYPWCVGDGWLFYDDIISALSKAIEALPQNIYLK